MFGVDCLVILVLVATLTLVMILNFGIWDLGFLKLDFGFLKLGL